MRQFQKSEARLSRESCERAAPAKNKQRKSKKSTERFNVFVSIMRMQHGEGSTLTMSTMFGGRQFHSSKWYQGCAGIGMRRVLGLLGFDVNFHHSTTNGGPINSIPKARMNEASVV